MLASISVIFFLNFYFSYTFFNPLMSRLWSGAVVPLRRTSELTKRLTAKSFRSDRLQFALTNDITIKHGDCRVERANSSWVMRGCDRAKSNNVFFRSKLFISTNFVFNRFLMHFCSIVINLIIGIRWIAMFTARICFRS